MEHNIIIMMGYMLFVFNMNAILGFLVGKYPELKKNFFFIVAVFTVAFTVYYKYVKVDTEDINMFTTALVAFGTYYCAKYIGRNYF